MLNKFIAAGRQIILTGRSKQQLQGNYSMWQWVNLF